MKYTPIKWLILQTRVPVDLEKKYIDEAMNEFKDCYFNNFMRIQQFCANKSSD